MSARPFLSARGALLFGAFAISAALAGAACDDAVPSDQTSSSEATSSSATTSSSSSGSGGTGGAGGGAPGCIMNPKTHVEIINACTDAQKVDIMPVLPLIGPNGKLPPLP